MQAEREEAISIVREAVFKTYPPQLYSHTRVNLAVYGSMASGLAIDSSDVDLAVTGHSFNGDQQKQLDTMQRLVNKLGLLHCKHRLQFIDTASVPVIKLEIDL